MKNKKESLKSSIQSSDKHNFSALSASKEGKVEKGIMKICVYAVRGHRYPEAQQ